MLKIAVEKTTRRRPFEVSGTCQLSTDHVSVEQATDHQSIPRIPPAYLLHTSHTSAARANGNDTGAFFEHAQNMVPYDQYGSNTG